MSEIDLAQKFPRLEPVQRPPSLFMFNGFGTAVYGRRDEDLETGAEAALADPDVRRVIDLVVEDTERYPQQASPFDLALLRTARPEVAADLVSRARARDVVGMWSELRHRLSPTSVPSACNEHWYQLMQGRPAQAAAVLRATADLGVPIPEQLRERPAA